MPETLGGLRVVDDDQIRLGASRDYWPRVAKQDQAGRPANVVAGVVFPRNTTEVSDVLADAHRRGIAIVPVGLRSGVCGALEPRGDEIAVDLTELDDIAEIDDVSLTARVGAGLRGSVLEEKLFERGLTLGHYPQSLFVSSVGGWIATRASGIASTGYGSIERRVLGITVVLADGTIIETPSWPRASVGPDMTQLFVGSEGALGVVCEATLALQPVPETRVLEAWVLPALKDGLDLVRGLVQSGLAPAIVRLYNAAEARRFHEHDVGALAVLVFEGLADVIECQRRLVAERLSDAGCEHLGSEPALRWWEHRYDASALFGYGTRPGGIADAIEIATSWKGIDELIGRLEAELRPLCTTFHLHASHFYPTGASAYLIVFLDAKGPEEVLVLYDEVWRRAMDVCIDLGAAISHHHGVGRVRLPWIDRSLGSAFELLARLKTGLDPEGTLSPGRLVGAPL